MADLVITATSVVPGSGATISTGTAGEAITAGQVLYLKTADSRMWKAQADGTVEEATVEGIALHAASAGQPVSFITAGSVTIGATTVKSLYFLSATAGGIAPFADLTSGHRIVCVGYATSTAGAFVVLKVNTGAAV